MANFNFNTVILGGRLTADPELKQTQSGINVTSFTVAVNRGGKSDEQKTDFITCNAWRQTAEFISNYFHKASSICVMGELQVRDWTDKDGNKRYSTEVNVNKAFFVDSKADAPAAQNTEPETLPEAPTFEELGEGDDLPF